MYLKKQRSVFPVEQTKHKTFIIIIVIINMSYSIYSYSNIFRKTKACF